MSKIGMSVCYDTKNYGSQLQVLATIKMIEKLGNHPEIIVYNKKLSPRFVLQTIPRLFNLSFVKSKIKGNSRDKKLKKNPEYYNMVQQRNGLFDLFVHDYFSGYMKSYNGWEKLCYESSNNYDAYLCGSDQLWLPNNLGSHFYTLEFAPENKPKVAYATSFGVNQIPWFQKGRTRRYLNRFSSLSSREKRGTEIIRELTGKEVPVVCDPTLLFSSTEWDQILPRQNLLNGPYIFCYYLGKNENHRNIAKQLKKETGLKIVTCPFLDHYIDCDLEFGDCQMYDINAAGFINLIRNAECVLTDSFHGTVFSILNHKKFITFNRFNIQSKNSRNSRIDTLCEITGLEKRRYNERINISDQMNKDIDYEMVDKKLDIIRNKSKEYLENALNNHRN